MQHKQYCQSRNATIKVVQFIPPPPTHTNTRAHNHTHKHTAFRWLTVLAMTAYIHDQAALLQSLLHAGLPVCVAHFCHLLPVHRQHLVSDLELAYLGLAACNRRQGRVIGSRECTQLYHCSDYHEDLKSKEPLFLHLIINQRLFLLISLKLNF